MKPPKIIAAKGNTLENAYTAFQLEVDRLLEPGYRLSSMSSIMIVEQADRLHINAGQPIPIMVVSGILNHDFQSELFEELGAETLAKLKQTVKEYISLYQNELEQYIREKKESMELMQKRENCEHEWTEHTGNRGDIPFRLGGRMDLKTSICNKCGLVYPTSFELPKKGYIKMFSVVPENDQPPH